MKKITSIMVLLLMAATTLTLTSCNDDEEISNTLWGVWQGNMGMYYQSYNDYVYDASRTIIAFDKDPGSYSSGTGYWIDYYTSGSYSYYASTIEWTVYNGVITILSVEDGEYWYISDYSLSYNSFSGILYSDESDPMQFSLYKTSSPNWNDYDWGGWSYNDYYGYGYAKKPTRSADSTSVVPKRMIRGNMPAEK